MRRAAKVDDNQAEIVKALRKAGFKVEIIKKPVDLLVSNRKRTFLVEVKNEEGKNTLTKEQVDFFARWPGEWHIVRSPEQAVAAAVGKEAMK